MTTRSSRPIALTLSLALLLALPSTAAAGAETPAAPMAGAGQDKNRDDEPAPKVWYGYKLLLADALSIGVVMVGARSGLGAGLVAPGIGGAFLAAPIVHLTEGQRGRALGSLGLRLLLPLGVGLVAAQSQERRSGECNCMGGVFAFAGGMVLGLGAAMILDAALLGWRPVGEVERAQAAKARSRSLALVPAFGVGPAGASVGVAGRF